MPGFGLLKNSQNLVVDSGIVVAMYTLPLSVFVTFTAKLLGAAAA